jgi:hypothetical protein
MHDKVDREPQQRLTGNLNTPVVAWPDGVAIFAFLSEASVFKANSATLFVPSSGCSAQQTESD